MVDCTPPIILVTFGEPGFLRNLEIHPIFKLIDSMTLRFRIPGSIEIFLLPPPLTDPAALSSFFQEALPEVAKALKMGPGTWDRKPLKKVPGPGWCFFTEETRYRGFRWLERKP